MLKTSAEKRIGHDCDLRCEDALVAEADDENAYQRAKQKEIESDDLTVTIFVDKSDGHHHGSILQVCTQPDAESVEVCVTREAALTLSNSGCA